MVRKIIVGYRHDSHGEDALALARMLASAAPVEEVVVAEGLRAGHRRLASVEEGWPQHIHVTTRAAAAGSAADTLASLVETEGADAVVLGPTHRHFAGRVLLGTTAGSLLKGTSCTVAIAPPGLSDSAAVLRSIGVAVDGSTTSRAALRWAADLASTCSATPRLISVVEPPPPPVDTWGEGVPAEAWAGGLSVVDNGEVFDAIRERVRRDLTAAAESIGRRDADTLTVVGDAAHALQDAAKDLDMLVVGSHGRGRLAGAMLGSVSRALANSCPAPLVVVPLAGERGPDLAPQQAAH